MRFVALVADFDGTLASRGRVADATLRALDRLVASGRRLVLATGRELGDLEHVFPGLDRFEQVVAENGAVLFTPATREVRLLEEPPPDAFVRALRARGVAPLLVGSVIVATREPHETTVLEVVRDLGLSLHVEFNKGSVMVLPAGTTKRSGLAVALREMGLSRHNAVGVGDAENDHAFLAWCECAVAVADALPSVRHRADWVAGAPDGAGVAQLADRLVADDLASVRSLRRHALLLGHEPEGPPVTVDAHGESVLVCGPSGSGKSTITLAIVERLVNLGYQACIVDPEGDHEHTPGAIEVGTAEHAPTLGEVFRALESPGRSVVASLVACSLEERAAWFAALLQGVREMRAKLGRPHWLVLDEAHHLLPAGAAGQERADRIGDVVFVTVHPEALARGALAEVDVVVAAADRARETLRGFASAVGRRAPHVPAPDGLPVAWRVRERAPTRFELAHARRDHLRHKAKYAAGELGEDKSFYFRGPSGALNLRAQNLALFVQIADGVDDATWLHHLRAGDYSRWVRDAIKDPELADEVRSVEAAAQVPARQTRQRVRAAIQRRYTLPAAAAPQSSRRS